MPRLLDARDLTALPAALTLARGDVVLFAASGGHVLSGLDVVEMIGPFTSGLVLADGAAMSPAGGPNALLFRARKDGVAQVDVIRGAPWDSVTRSAIKITVRS